MVGIYGIHNKVTDKWYIGQSIDIDRRLRHHEWALTNGHHYNTRLLNSWKSHGRDSFEFVIIEQCNETELDVREIHWIWYYDSLRNGYNLCEGGNTCRGRIVTDEMKQRESEARLGSNNPMYGKSQTEYHKLRMKELQSGDKNRMHGKYGKDHPRSRMIKCIETGVIYHGFREAERETGIDRNNICSCCNGRLKTAGKLHWEYVS